MFCLCKSRSESPPTQLVSVMQDLAQEQKTNMTLVDAVLKSINTPKMRRCITTYSFDVKGMDGSKELPLASLVNAVVANTNTLGTNNISLRSLFNQHGFPADCFLGDTHALKYSCYHGMLDAVMAFRSDIEKLDYNDFNEILYVVLSLKHWKVAGYLLDYKSSKIRIFNENVILACSDEGSQIIKKMIELGVKISDHSWERIQSKCFFADDFFKEDLPRYYSVIEVDGAHNSPFLKCINTAYTPEGKRITFPIPQNYQWKCIREILSHEGALQVDYLYTHPKVMFQYVTYEHHLVHLIFLAAEAKEYNVTRALLKHAPLLANLKDHSGWTPLHIAAANGDLKLAELLLENFAHVHHCNNENETPLHIAAAKGHLELVQFLVQNGANQELKDKAGKTPLQVASDKGLVYISTYLSSKLGQ
jgi:hypothetical protein